MYRFEKDEFSLSGDEGSQVLGDGFVITPQPESISLMTDDLYMDESDTSTMDTPLAEIISKSVMNIFSSKGDKMSDGRKVHLDNDIFLDSPTASEVKAATIDSPPSTVLRPQNNDIGQKDFLKDSKKDMTFSRRIALFLIKYDWYNPNNKTKDTEKSSEEEYGYPPSLAKAWAHFEHFTLRRYITEEDEDDLKLGRGKGVNMADPGEGISRTKLYSPISTPLSQISDFGSDIGLYFFTLRTLAVMTFVAGLINIPNLIYFSGDSYSSGQNDLNFLLQGSAVCPSYEWVPCPDCSIDDFKGEERYRFHLEILSNGELLVFALKNKCNGVTLSAGFVSFFTLLFVALSMLWIFWYLSRQEASLDESAQTAKDYSIQILNPPKDAINPSEWKDFFRDNFDDIHVKCCTVGVENKNLLTYLLRRRECQEALRQKLRLKRLPNRTELMKVTRDHKQSRNAFQNLYSMYFPGVPELFKRIRDLDLTIKRECINERETTNVFVTFETKRSQREVLKVFNVAPHSVKTNNKKALRPSKLLFRDDLVLNIKEADDPSTVRWQDLEETISGSIRKVILPTLVTVLLIVLSSFAVRYILKEKQSTTYAAITVSLLNAFVTSVVKYLTGMESHRSEEKNQISLYVKLAAFRWINTVVLLGLVTPLSSSIMPGDKFLLQGVYKIFFTELVISNVLHLLDISGNFNRHIKAPRAVTQEDMNMCMEGSEIHLAERYTSMATIVFLALWFCSIYPGALFLCSFVLFLNYYVDGFNLMRTWKQTPRLGGAISFFNRTYFFPIALVTMSVTASYFWGGFNFDNLCRTDYSDDSSYINSWYIPFPFMDYDGDIMMTEPTIINENSTTYAYCNQNLLNRKRLAFPFIPTSQNDNWMTGDQKVIVSAHCWVSLFIIIIVFVLFLRNLINRIWVFYQGLENKSRNRRIDIPFSHVNRGAYIPQIKSHVISYPLFACDVDKITDQELIDWDSPYHPYKYYDLTEDAKEILKEAGVEDSLSKSAFSQVVIWV